MQTHKLSYLFMQTFSSTFLPFHADFFIDFLTFSCRLSHRLSYVFMQTFYKIVLISLNPWWFRKFSVMSNVNDEIEAWQQSNIRHQNYGQFMNCHFHIFKSNNSIRFHANSSSTDFSCARLVSECPSLREEYLWLIGIKCVEIRIKFVETRIKFLEIRIKFVAEPDWYHMHEICWERCWYTLSLLKQLTDTLTRSLR